ncbi:mating-type alpha-pheromone receptor PreB [Akanthomyces lecanii RCEF 1005]|uniref:Mating-type alpha-pheromone receptor PreB n=1 Tax=Akanthomyces lecanii RCEF 1005 TaxID=1081108 RepID=A0A168IZL0_CORDF|nr:mating-type alpha-pheromone receptor PreB [Akanthomyces lecanii RCEF 1005]
MDGPPPTMTPDPSFDRFDGNVTFFLADRNTTASVPMAALNAFNDETISVTMNYGAQLGACVVMFLVVLVLTPSAKLVRASAVLHLTGLLLCAVRTGLLFSYYVAPFSHFYQVWGGDFSRVPHYYYSVSLAANTLALPLVVVMQAALMNQAWTMVAFWPRAAKYVACALSAVIVLLTVGTRLAFTIVQNRAIVTAVPPEFFFWGIHWTLIMGAISIFWFCAVFNVKLVSHLVTNRGILPSTTLVNPMEVLIMTNGFLMIIPSIFAGLEWAKFTNFESGSLTLTSVILILPLGTLTAQRISSQGSQSYMAGEKFRKQQPQTRSAFGAASSHQANHTKPASVTFSSNGTTVTPQISAGSRPEVSLMDRPERMDPIDLELSRIDACRESFELSQGAEQQRRMQRDDFV